MTAPIDRAAEQDLTRRLVAQRRDAFDAGSALRAPHPSRPASKFGVFMANYFGHILGFFIVLAVIALGGW